MRTTKAQIEQTLHIERNNASNYMVALQYVMRGEIQSVETWDDEYGIAHEYSIVGELRADGGYVLITQHFPKDPFNPLHSQKPDTRVYLLDEAYRSAAQVSHVSDDCQRHAAALSACMSVRYSMNLAHAAKAVNQ